MAEGRYWRRLHDQRLSRRRLLRGAAIGGVGLVGLTLVGCGDGGEDQAAADETSTNNEALANLESAARSEGKVTFYSSNPPEVSERVANAFKERHGVDVEIVRLSSGPLSQRFAAEAEAGTVTADVLQLADPLFFDDAVTKGWIARLEKNELPAGPDWPEQFWKNGYVLVGSYPITISYNNQLVKADEAPKEWRDLLDPKWKGKILLVDPRGVPTWMAWLLMLKESYGEDFLRRFGQQDLRLVSSAVPGTQQMAAGEAHILVPNLRQVIVSLVAQGAPLADATPEPSTGVEQLLGVSGKAPHPNAARLFMNFLMTPAGQTALLKDLGASGLRGVPDVLDLPNSYQSPKIREAEAQRDQLLRLVGIG